jgi:hypothetical protein
MAAATSYPVFAGDLYEGHAGTAHAGWLLEVQSANEREVRAKVLECPRRRRRNNLGRSFTYTVDGFRHAYRLAVAVAPGTTLVKQERS